MFWRWLRGGMGARSQSGLKNGTES
jgi:hypothetical protein